MVNIDKVYDRLTDILDYIECVINYNNPSEAAVLRNIAKMILLVQGMIDENK